MEPKVGDMAVCSQCNTSIVFVGPYWDHPCEIKPRHPAIPIGENKPGYAGGVKYWADGFAERDRKHIAFARNYAEHFAHGAPGHLDLMLIATLARYIDFITDQEPEAR